MLKNKIITCVDCGQKFAYTAGEQEYYAQKKMEEPKRCPICQGTLNAAKQDNFRGKIER